MALCQCQPIRLVTFDALYTLVVPRIPVHLQYAQVFEPYLGVLDPLDLKKSFRSAFQFTEKDKLVYTKGSHLWWSQVIKRTAIGAGADENAVDASLSQMVPQLLRRFSSKEGYKAFDDALPAGIEDFTLPANSLT
ncbi:hypothetical protein H0H93_002781 [Arthromyces matolae]|nr:hypothetical protein H0H93_002781 [Arthromyces matolae]